MIPLLFLGRAIRSNVNLRLVVTYFVSMILVFSLYIVYVGGDFMDMFRFLVPILPFFFFLIQEGFRGLYQYAQHLSEKQQKVALRTSVILLIGLSLFLLAYPSKESNKIWGRQGIDSIGSLRDSARLWSKVGLMFKGMAKSDESLSTFAAGAIPYYSELYAIDELGLNLASQSNLMIRKVLRPGHLKEVTDEFLLSRKPTYILSHPRIYDDYQQIQGVWGIGELFWKAGYKPTVFTIKISEDEKKYLYCLSLKKSHDQMMDHQDR